MNKKIKTNINFLPLNILSRYELFLTLHNKKPSCAIVLKDDKTNYHKKVQSFIHKNGLHHTIDSLDSKIYFVSRVKESTLTLQQIWNLSTVESTFKKGILLGYPKKAVILFSKYVNTPHISKYLSVSKNPYGGYMVRKKHEIEDVLISKNWRSFVEKNNPVLVKWLDKKILPHLNK